jgi:hypothetical protein
MKSSMKKIFTHWDDYNSEILPKVGTGYPEKPGQVLIIKKKI